MIGQQVRLVPLDETYTEKIMKDWNNPEMRVLFDGYIPSTTENQREWLQSIERRMKSREIFFFAILRLDDNSFLGTLGLSGIDWLSRSSTLGITIHRKEDWNQGFGTESLKLIIDFAWDHLNLRRIELDVHSHNPRAIHVYEKIGFQRYGTAHGKYFRNGSYVDTYYMELFRKTSD